MKHVFIIGSKGIPAKYGGFETFVDKLVSNRVDKDIQYFVSCLAEKPGRFEYNGAKCFNVTVPNIGPAKAVLYDMRALKMFAEYIKNNNIENDSIIYILASRIGKYLKRIKRKYPNIKIFLNPDGQEWKRKKWNFLIRKYWKYSEKNMLKYADHVVCDSINIQNYIENEYPNMDGKVSYISYGSDIDRVVTSSDYKKWLSDWNIKEHNYYLMVGRFVPENNYQIVIEEFIKSGSNKKLVIISNHTQNKKLFDKIKKMIPKQNDNIIFTGTLYDQEILKNVRSNCFSYIHGHEVGGTNPSLLEALAYSKMNILLDVSFNREVAEDYALYFKKEAMSLATLIKEIENNSQLPNKVFKSRERIIDFYSWDKIVNAYEELFNKYLKP